MDPTPPQTTTHHTMSFFGTQRVDVFQQAYQAFSGVYIDKSFLDEGGKIILPSSALHQISQMNVVWPLMLKITNPLTKQSTHCGVLEFSAEEGRMYVPLWLMENLGIQPGQMTKCETASLRKGRFVKLRPRKKEFVETADPKAILERKLRDFSCLTRGDTIVIVYNNKRYEIDVMDVKDDQGPCDAISIVETDINLEFDRPLDMPESPKAAPAPSFGDQTSSGTASNAPRTEADLLFETPIVSQPPLGVGSTDKDKKQEEEKKEEEPRFKAFAGSGFRIDGKPISPSPKSSRTTTTTTTSKSTPSSQKKTAESKDDYWSSLGSGRSLK